MASFTKGIQVTKSVNNVIKGLANLSLLPNVNAAPSLTFAVRRVPTFQCAFIHSTPRQNGLMEFFDDPKNWAQDRVRVGRSWKTDELRLKSNEELHKLWFVLLKERNMLLTMEEAYKQEWKYFPNPERIDKVEDSMTNLETVVRERNKAYHLLETGTDGERPAVLRYNPLGIRSLYRMRQYRIPKFMNTKWKKTHMFGYGGRSVHKFLRLYREKLWNAKRKERNRERNKVLVLMRTFPNLDLEAVKEKYPSVDLEKAKRDKKTDGHFIRD